MALILQADSTDLAKFNSAEVFDFSNELVVPPNHPYAWLLVRVRDLIEVSFDLVHD